MLTLSNVRFPSVFVAVPGQPFLAGAREFTSLTCPTGTTQSQFWGQQTFERLGPRRRKWCIFRIDNVQISETLDDGIACIPRIRVLLQKMTPEIAQPKAVLFAHENLVLV